MLPSLLRESGGTSKRRAAQSFMVTSQESLVLRVFGSNFPRKMVFYDKNWRIKVLEFLAIILRYTYILVLQYISRPSFKKVYTKKQDYHRAPSRNY